jgi:hypothetical protein
MKNIVFIPIPRNASGSIEDAIKENSNFHFFEKSYDLSSGDSPESCNDARGSSWHYAKQILETKNISWNECFKAAVIRNPWSRVVSMYHHDHANPLKLKWSDFLRTLPSMMIGRIYENSTTNELSIPFYQKRNEDLRRLGEGWSYHSDVAKFQHHTLPQVYHFFDDNHKSVLDYSLDFDNLQENFDKFMDFVEEDRVTLGLINYSSKNGRERSSSRHYREFYTEDWMIKLIGSIYKYDIDFGKYEF